MSTLPKIDIEGLQFEWDLEKGKFLFEGEDAVLFWISSAMKTFFDTIEEVSGQEATCLVMESTGYRQGAVVGKYFEDMTDISIEKIAGLITNTYASAGWGRAYVKNLDVDNYTLTVQLKDDWEYKINQAQGKKTGGNFLAAHYAGIFTGLFKTDIWYKILQHQIEGHEYTTIEYFPKEVNVAQNIHQLARQKEAEQIEKLEKVVEEKTKELKELIKTISSPVIPVLEGIVVVSLLGKYDEERADELIVKTLYNLPKHKASYLVLDLTGMDDNLTPYTASMIEKLGCSAELLGIKTILVGISAQLSLEITKADIDLTHFDFFQSLQHGIHFALAQNGRRII
ncbi:STAS domain-containing protein [Sutcliffiella horikoshii]|uniref:STAS domain-containing protein n=1 Tax=Sutcliffiella horikoshii TaxID=79883 RepID=UPI001CBB3E07|nr:STAS domain-containing protein [Sutcliffiella horikoshii]UAL47903.1 STAS domain-containing protein [Sutcliffiella horikoshii]